MPLIGDYKNVQNVDELIKDQLEHAKLHYFCFAMMAIEVGEVTEENLGDVWARVDFTQNYYNGGWFLVDGVSYDYKMEDVAKYVGYKTNCSTTHSNAYFFGQKADHFAKDYLEKMLKLRQQPTPTPTPKPKRRKAAQVVA
jgi:hypothetical protein